MISTLDKLEKTLRQSSYSYTKSRAMVFQAIEQNGPLSMHRLTSMLRQSVDRASIYRTVDLFEKLGVVQRLQTGWKFQIELTDEYSEHHHHMTCTNCGTVFDFHEDNSLVELLKNTAQKYNFALTGHQVELQGICANCAFHPEIVDAV
jgi:Fur family ferric uptake transcriptional regulator